MKCLEKDPARRPQSGRELIEELDRCEKAQASVARTPSFKDFSECTTVADTPARFPRSATTFGEESAPASPGATEVRTALPSAIAPLPAVPSVAGSQAIPTNSSHVSGPADYSQPAEKIKSPLRSMVMVTVVVLVLAAGTGGWYFFGRSSGHQPAPVENKDRLPVGVQPAASQSTSPPSSPIAGEAGGTQASSTQSGSPQPPATPSREKRSSPEATAPAPSLSAEERAARAKKASAASSLGDLYFENGEFDNAMKEYQLGLDADPSNKTLPEKLDRARKAKDTAASAKP
jgi:hypothetical protein